MPVWATLRRRLSRARERRQSTHRCRRRVGPGQCRGRPGDQDHHCDVAHHTAGHNDIRLFIGRIPPSRLWLSRQETAQEAGCQKEYRLGRICRCNLPLDTADERDCGQDRQTLTPLSYGVVNAVTGRQRR